MQKITYGEGGFDPSKSDGNVVAVEEVPDVETPDDRLSILLGELTKATTLAQVRAAAANASDS